MKSILLGATILAALSVPAAAATLGIQVFDNGTLIDQLSGITSGTAQLITGDASFRDIQVDVEGSPTLPLADLSSTNLDATVVTGFTGTHVLTVDIFQDGVSGHGPTSSTFTVNGLIGGPGPTTESSFAGGSSTTLGTLLSTHTFPASITNGSVQLGAPAGAFTADALQYSIAFTAANQSFGGSSELTTSGAVPETPTWAMFIVGFALLGGGFAWRKAEARLTPLA